MSSYDRPASADRPKKKRGEHKKRSARKREVSKGPEPEHRILAKQLKALEARGQKGTPAYKKVALDHRTALSACLKALGCDLTDAELRGLNKPDAEGEVPLHKVVYEYFALQQGATGPGPQAGDAGHGIFEYDYALTNQSPCTVARPNALLITHYR